MFTYRYGGKEGKAQSLIVSDDKVVIRTNRVLRLEDAIQDEESRQLLHQLSPITEFPDANVVVLQVQAPEADQIAVRDSVRRKFSQEEGVRFAGRVLHDPETGVPVIYTQNFFVKFHNNVSHDQNLTILQKYGLTVKDKLGYSENAWFVAAPEKSTAEEVFQIAEKLLSESETELCHPELIRPVGRRKMHPSQWHLARTSINGKDIDTHINIESAWEITKGEGITIAIIDDGVDIDHEEFNHKGKIVHPRDVTLQIDDPRPKIDLPAHYGDSHGTACAGIACAEGKYQASGVAPASHLMPIRLRSGLGSKAEADAFRWAADHGADVISCSWGPEDGDWRNPYDVLHHQNVQLPDMIREAIDYTLTHGRNGKGCIIVWAAGNGNESVDNDGYASYEPVIAVAACNDHSKRSVYSDYGKAIWCCFPSNDFEWLPYHHPAPHTRGIWTTDRSGPLGYNPGLHDPNGLHHNNHIDYTEEFGGTSSACPGVAGIVALMLSVNPNLHYTEVKDLLRKAAVKIDEIGGRYDANDHSIFYGYGRVDAGLAVQLVPPTAHYMVQVSE